MQTNSPQPQLDTDVTAGTTASPNPSSIADPQPSLSAWYSYFRDSPAGFAILAITPPLELSRSEDAQFRHIVRNTRFVEANEAMAALLARPSREDLIGRTWSEVIDRTGDRQVFEPMRRFISQGFRWQDYDSFTVDDSGAPRYFMSDLYGTPRDGKIATLNWTLREVTHFRRSEEELRQRETLERNFSRRLKILNEVRNELVYGETHEELWRRAVVLGQKRLDFDRIRVLAFDESASRLRGLWGIDEHGNLRDEHQTRHALDLESDFARALALKPGRSLLIENVELTDHRLQPVGEGSRAFAALHEDQRPIGLIVIDNLIHRNPISEMDLQILELLADSVSLRNWTLKAAQRDSPETATYRSLIEDVLESSQIGITILDASRRVVWANKTVERFFGMSRKMLIGADGMGMIEIQLQSFVEYPENFAEGLRLAYQDPDASIKQEFRIRPAENRLARWLELHSQPIRSGIFEGGRIEQFFDITDRKNAESALLTASQMENAMRMSVGIAHDLNNLMVSVLGNAELLRAGRVLPLDDAAKIEDISGAAHRASDLAQQLLAFAHTRREDRSIVSFNARIDDFLRLHPRMVPQRITLRKDLAADLWAISADPIQINQIVLNLTQNAIEAIEGTGQVTLVTRNADLFAPLKVGQIEVPPGAYIRFDVRDTGVGIPADTLAEIFEAFYTTKYRGRGLGLAAVTALVRKHDGRIAVESDPMRGSVFSVFLPAIKEAAPSEPVESVSPLNGTETLLLIDDEGMVLDVTKKMLMRYGYRVLTANNGAEALEIAQSADENIALAILDMGMPGLSGPDTFPLLRMTRPDMRILICSGFEKDEEIHRLLSQGASSFIRKPWRLQEMLTKLRTILDPHPK